jgi:hypothetical protein
MNKEMEQARKIDTLARETTNENSKHVHFDWPKMLPIQLLPRRKP